MGLPPFGSALLSALRQPVVRLFLLGGFGVSVGIWIQRITVGWLVFDLTQSAAWVGGVATCEVLATLLISPCGGVLADRSDRVRMLAFGQGASMAIAFALAAGTSLGAIPVAALVVAVVLLGLIDGLNQPMRLTLLSDVTPRELVPPTVALNSFFFNTARFAGPAVAGFALAFGGPALAFGLFGLLFVPQLFLLAAIKRRQLAPPKLGAMTLRDGVGQGARYIAGHAAIGPLFLLLIATAFLARPVLELLPAISATWFDPSPTTLAELSSSVGVGAMAGGILMMTRTSARANLTPALLGCAGQIAAAILFALFGTERLVAYALLALSGFCVVVCAIGVQTMIHLIADPAYRGRMLSYYVAVQRGLPAIGALGVGFLADRVGFSAPIVGAGLLAAAAWLFIFLRRRRIALGLPGPE